MKKQTIAPKRWWFIMPIVFITYSLAYLDRANFSFASAAGINDDLGITKGMSSLLGALFFLGYFFFQIPGAVYAERRSVKKLIFWCLVLWGTHQPCFLRACSLLAPVNTCMRIRTCGRTSSPSESNTVGPPS